MEFIKAHKWAIIGGVLGLLFARYIINQRAAAAAQQAAQAQQAQDQVSQYGQGTQFLNPASGYSSSGASGSSANDILAALAASGFGSGSDGSSDSGTGSPVGPSDETIQKSLDTQVKVAKIAGDVAKTSVLAGVENDVLGTFLANVGNGQKIDIGYNDLGQITDFGKSPQNNTIIDNTKPPTGDGGNHIDTTAIIKDIYQNVLGRPVDASALNYWNSVIASGGIEGGGLEASKADLTNKIAKAAASYDINSFVPSAGLTKEQVAKSITNAQAYLANQAANVKKAA